jgi:hypothetical protein
MVLPNELSPPLLLESPMKRVLLSVCLSLVATAALMPSLGYSAVGAERDNVFFQNVEGNWTGPGEIVAGKYKGTKFVCNFTGAAKSGKAGMSLDGDCRVGLFTQKMNASFEHNGRDYKGKFMDGAAGKGLDIISGNVDGNKVILAVNRAQLDGVMQARIPNEDTMNVTVSVKVDKKLVPVIGVNLKRVDATAVGSIEPSR